MHYNIHLSNLHVHVSLQDFFHNPPSYQAKVRLSWGVEVSGGLQGECKTSDVRGVINAITMRVKFVKRLPH